MNREATIDSVLSSIGKPPVVPNVVFSQEETKVLDSIDVMLEDRILTLLKRDILTQLEIELLDVLLKNRPEGGY